MLFVFRLVHLEACNMSALKTCLSPGRSKPRNVPSAARTFSDIEPWALLEANLDDTKQQYRQNTFTITGASVRQRMSVR